MPMRLPPLARSLVLLAMLIVIAACQYERPSPQGTDCVQDGRRGRQADCN
jgi:hypothetical protein